MKEITSFLIEQFGMKKVYKNSSTEIGEVFTAAIRISDLQYLFWNENMKHFYLAQKNEKPKGMPRGEKFYWVYIPIPRIINSIQTAQEVLNALFNTL